MKKSLTSVIDLRLVLVACVLLLTTAYVGAASEVVLTSAMHTVGVIEPGEQIASENIVVDQASKLRIIVLSQVELDVEFILPDGTSITPGNAGSHGILMLNIPGPEQSGLLIFPDMGAGANVTADFSAPKPGIYEVHVDAGAPVSELTPFAISAYPESDVKVAVTIPEPETLINKPVAIAALVFEGVSPIQNATVEVSILSVGTKELTTSLQLFDDGIKADQDKGDGIYTGVLPDGLPKGRYAVVADIEGESASGVPFRRGASADMIVTDPSSTLTGTFSASGIDLDGNGLFEFLQLEAGVNIGNSGEFDLAMLLRASNDKTVGSNRVQSLGAGEKNIQVTFPASYMQLLGNDSPYTLALAQLDELTENERLLQDRAYDAATISGFELSDFEGYDGPVSITIDIKPGSDRNTIRLKSTGVVPVAILSTSDFDAVTVDPASVSLAGANVKTVGKRVKYLCQHEDVNLDGLVDLLCKVYRAQLMIEEGVTTAILEAETFDGVKLRGEDSIRIKR